jgi:UDP-GlcNAc3NAcA epimerase
LTIRTILTIVGARPQFIKAAALSRTLRKISDFREILVHTGQHYDEMMSDVFFNELEIPKPEENLSINRGGHGDMTGRMLQGLEQTLIARKPDWVLVFGDTNSTLAGALAAAKLHIPVIHVEAGLRSYNRHMPEEVNRVLTDHVSTLLFCPTRTAVKNLEVEGITKGVYHVGDIMYDALLYSRTRARVASNILTQLDIQDQSYVLATIHRAENTDEPTRLRAVIDKLVAESKSRLVVMPTHPRTRQIIDRLGVEIGPIRMVAPVGYFDMIRLLEGCELVMTDSGGLQKEAYFFRRPCITLRDETEWPETIIHGWNKLWSQKSWAPRSEIDDFGAGDAADKIVAVIRDHMNK